jgi:haloacetate dehalogenase
MFLAQPHPFPETMISAQSSYYIDSTLMSWSGSHKLDHFEPAALAQYRANAADQTILRAMCDDYRANASIDTAIDEADIAAGRKIAAPTLAIWGAMGLADSTSDFQKSWTRWCEKLDCAGLPSGHFLPEEAPKETAEALDCFFKTDA